LLRDRHGQWTYQFCVVVDDIHDMCSLIIRGQDLLDSTSRQILLGKLLGRTDPAVFAHHALLTDTSGHKLSKRTLATGLEHWRSQGITASQLLGLAAVRAGLVKTPEGQRPPAEVEPWQLAGFFSGLIIDN
jgi:glutamyl/glutaminyl-tRNA synthetase